MPAKQADHIQNFFNSLLIVLIFCTSFGVLALKHLLAASGKDQNGLMIFKVLDLEVFAQMLGNQPQDLILKQKLLNMLAENGPISEKV